MEEFLLTPANVLDGSRVVQVRTRPVRVAYVLPEDQPRIAVRAIESCCLTWGGVSHFLIPYSQSTGLTDEWRQVLDNFDPDDIVDCAGMASEEVEYRKQLGQFVHRWGEPDSTAFLLGTCQYSVLNALGYGRRSGDHDFVLQPTLAEAESLYLSVVARWGHLDERFIGERLKYYGLPPHWRYQDFLQIAEHDFQGDNIEILAGGTPDTTRFTLGRGGGTFSFTSFPDLTLASIPQYGPSYSYGGGSAERSQHDEAYVTMILITGTPDSVSDLCLYWNLRAQRIGQISFFPLWLPLPILTSPEGAEGVQRAVARISTREAEGLGPLRGLHVLSSSMEADELIRSFPSEIEVARFETTHLSKYLASNIKLGYVEEKEVPFSHGNGRIPRSQVALVGQLAPFDRVTHEVSIQGLQLPQSRSLRSRLGGPLLRISKDGLEHFFQARYQADLTEVQLPSAWTVLTSVFEDAGYWCEPSDKGRLALALLGLLGGLDGLPMLAKGSVQRLLGGLSSVMGRQGAVRGVRRLLEARGADAIAGDVDQLVDRVLRSAPVESVLRPDQSYAEIEGVLGKADAPKILKWLLDRRVLFRGARLACPVCSLEKWYPVDRFGELLLCDGCQREVPFPGEPRSTQWRYKINELYARGYDQGIIPHLLLIGSRLPRLRQGFEESTLGFHPGLGIRATNDHTALETGIREMELDFAEIHDRRLILGECKVHGGDITEPELERLLSIAGRVGCSRVILATVTDFSASRKFIAELARTHSCQVDTLEAGQLLTEP